MPGICWIRSRALESLINEARAWPLRETGGALLGHRDGELAVIEQVLGPGPNAGHGLSHFEPDAKWQLGEGERIYAERDAPSHTSATGTRTPMAVRTPAGRTARQRR